MTDRLVHARQLRLRQTEAELRLWYHLRAHRFKGLKFRRQKPMGPYIVDFVCLECFLIIEVDGGQHNAQHGYDNRRDRWLKDEGFMVMRFWNHDVLNRTAEVLECISAAVEDRIPGTSPGVSGGTSST